MGATSAGAPTSGTFAVGDFIIDDTATVWICTAAGTPGTWSPSIQSSVVVRSATATAGQGELTIYGTSGTSGQTITLPANPQNGALYQIKNLSPYTVNILGGTQSISISGTIYGASTPYTIPLNCAYTFFYTGGVWYCMVTTDLAKMGNLLPTTSGGTGLSTIGTAGQALVVNSGATGLTYATVNNYVALTATGNTWVVPNGVSNIIVRLVAGGAGGGGGGSTSSNVNQTGGGGGGGGEVKIVNVAVTAGDTLTATIGAGGAGGAGGSSGGSGTTGNAGGQTQLTDTTSSTLLATCNGGYPGIGSPGSSNTVANGGLYAMSGLTSGTNSSSPYLAAGSGGISNSNSATVMQGVVGGAGGGNATTTKGGGGGNASTVATSALVTPSAAPGLSSTLLGGTGTTATTPGCGGGGGGAGSYDAGAAGSGGNGGAGAKGIIEIWY